MELNAVETCLFSQLDTVAELLLSNFDILKGHLLGDWIRDITQHSDVLPDGHGGRSPYLQSSIDLRVVGPSCVIYLDEYLGALFMEGICDLLPSFSVFFPMDVACPRE